MGKIQEVNQMQKDVISQLKMDYMKIMEEMKKDKGQEPIRLNPIAAQKPGGVRTIKGGVSFYFSV